MVDGEIQASPVGMLHSQVRSQILYLLRQVAARIGEFLNCGVGLVPGGPEIPDGHGSSSVG